MDAALRKKHVPTAAEQLADLPLNLVVDKSPIAPLPAPSAAGSATSEAASDALKPETQQAYHRVILACLARTPEGGCLSRWEIHRRTGISISTLCARLPELEPLHVEKVKGACRSHEKPTLRVNGYRLTAAGRSRVREVTP